MRSPPASSASLTPPTRMQTAAAVSTIPSRGTSLSGSSSGTEVRLDVAVGANRLATLLAKELLPLHRAELPTGGAETARPRRGSVGVVAGPSSVYEDAQKQKRGSRALVTPGTVVFAEVLGRTLSGRPLLSARRLYRRLAWHRARQIMQLTFLQGLRQERTYFLSFLLSLIINNCRFVVSQFSLTFDSTSFQGLGAFLPKFELMDRINTFTDLKSIEMTYLKEGTLLQRKVCEIFPYSAQVRITGTNRSGLLHISNISRGRVVSVSDILKIDDEVKVLVVKSNVPDKIALRYDRILEFILLHNQQHSRPGEHLVYFFQTKRRCSQKLRKWHRGIGMQTGNGSDF